MQKELVHLLFSFTFFCLLTTNTYAANTGKYASNLKFIPIPSSILPTNDVRILYQDSDGYIWLPTYNGLVRYDGYSVVNYGLNDGTNLSFNCYLNVVVEDHDKNLWIAAEKGVFKLHKLTGDIERIGNDKLESLNAADIFCTKNGDIWVGGDRGLFRKKKGEDIFERIDLPSQRLASVSSIIEDDRGDIWVAACEKGLFRYDVEQKKFYAYIDQVLYLSNVVYQDDKQQIWVGTWDRGLLRLATPYTTGRMQYDRFHRVEGEENSLFDNIVYDIGQDESHRIWVSTRSGLSIMHDESDFYSFENFLPEEGIGKLPYNEVSSILRTHDNQMWISMFGGGVCKIQTENKKFGVDRMEAVRSLYKTISIRNVFYAGDDEYWMGIIGFGMILYNARTHTCINYQEHPDFKDLPYTSTVDAIIRRKKTGEICFGTYSRGVWLYDEKSHKVRALNHLTQRKFENDCVHTLMEDSKGNLWIGTRQGVYILDAEDQFHKLSDWMPGVELDFLSSRVFDIKEDAEHHIWIATNYEGIVRLDLQDKTCRRYAVGQKRDVQNIFCLLVDSRQQIWAGSMWSGLSYYDRKQDAFVTINSFSTIENKGITNIVEDNRGKIWVTTNNTVLSFTMNDSHTLENINYYAVANEMETFSFNRSSHCKMADGRLLFGSSHGIRSFITDRIEHESAPFPLVFTDFKVHNQSLRSMSPDERLRFSSKDVNYADEITLTHRDNNFTVEFSLLNYVKPQENMYTYCLEGYDDKEIVVDAQRHFVTYNNLPSGSYLFHLKGTNEDGVWGSSERTLKIRILPAPWLTWWAYCIYGVILAAIFCFIFRFLRYKMRMQHEIQIGKLEKQKIQEINHLKLQFFTNITHELMTPLSIILASLENLKSGGDKRALHAVMAANATRLMRLIQQVLEFRKVESGNLKISVSYGDISSFLRSCAEVFVPLLGKRRQILSFESSPEEISGFFDSDKLDKVIYNLLSNAAKYTPEDGRISVKARLADEHTLQVDIANTGELMTQKTMDGLFKRFYEGDYRKHNTIGTGIGLSLVKDLITIHRGTIQVFSNEEIGNCFRILLPIHREAYQQGEINETIAAQTQTAFPVPIYIDETMSDPDKKMESLLRSDYTILIVDDNEELCMLFSNLLSNCFRVKTAMDGRHALKVLEEGGIDLVVSDIMMPDMDGIELCRYMKTKFEYSHIPVILLTAKRAEESQIEGYNSGADGYISKPCNFSLLYAQIMNCLKRQERKGADFRKQIVFEVGKLEYTSLDETFLQRAIDCVNARLSDADFDQAEFVSEMGTSRSVLTEKLKSLTGLTPSAFVQNVRLTAACKLMDEQGKIRISDLAFAVGFNDSKYFSTCFKKKYGMTPKEYIEQGRN